MLAHPHLYNPLGCGLWGRQAEEGWPLAVPTGYLWLALISLSCWYLIRDQGEILYFTAQTGLVIPHCHAAVSLGTGLVPWWLGAPPVELLIWHYGFPEQPEIFCILG